MILNRVYRRIFDAIAGVASLLRIVQLRLKYPGAGINFGCHISRGCRISCTDDSQMMLHNVYIAQNAVLIADDGGRLSISNSYVGFGAVIVAGQSIEIEDDCAIAEMVVIRDQDHRFGVGPGLRESGAEYSPVRIGRNVWIGSKATILRGVSIGDNSVVGASSVVTKDIATGSVAVGVPAKVVREIAAGRQ
jgi:acetyltransferase-like isoleucine patch superfamily enzyme